MQQQDIIDYGGVGGINNMSLKRDFSKARLSPRSDKADQVQGTMEIDQLDSSSVFEDSLKIPIHKKGLSQFNVLMKIKELQYLSKRSLNYSSQQPSREEALNHTVNQHHKISNNSYHGKKQSLIGIPSAESPIEVASHGYST
jgi:hypothetical protein